MGSIISIAERRQAKEVAEKTDESAAESAEQQEMTTSETTSESAGGIAIRGVSINLPYAKQRQLLTEKFGGERTSKEGWVFMPPDCSEYLLKSHNADDVKFFLDTLQLNEDIVGKQETILFNNSAAYGGTVSLTPICIVVDFNNSDDNGDKYLTALEKKYNQSRWETWTRWATVVSGDVLATGDNYNVSRIEVDIYPISGHDGVILCVQGRLSTTKKNRWCT